MIPLGYSIRDGKVVIDDVSAGQVRELFKSYVAGYRTAINLMVKARILVGLNKEQASNHLTEIQSNCLMLVLY